MAVEKINYGDTLRIGTDKINAAIDQANKSEIDASSAVGTANIAKSRADATATQLETVIIESGTSNAETLAARTDGNTAETFPTVGGRLDNVNLQVTKATDKVEGIYNIVEFGASPTKTDAENKTALQAAIDYVDSIGGGRVVVPYNISYGYSRNSLASLPNMSSATTDIIIIDYSKGKTYVGESRDGSQERMFFHTAGSETDGMHDGATKWHRANWHPAYMLSNDGETGVTDNRRATFFLANKGEVTWGIGQGTNTIAADGSDQDDVLSAFKIVGNKVAGGAGLETFLAILKTNGYWGLGTQDPTQEFHFRSKRSTHGRWMFERQGVGDVIFHLKTATKERRQELLDSTGLIRTTNVGGSAIVHELTDGGNAYFKEGVSGNIVTTANRPANRKAGTMTYDSDLDKPVWFNGSVWKDNMSRFVAKPLTATTAGLPGDWSADSTHLYVCHVKDTWKRVSIATW